MMATFNRHSFNVQGSVSVTMADGRRFRSDFPVAVWKWLTSSKGKDWASVTVHNKDLDEYYGWDRV